MLKAAGEQGRLVRDRDSGEGAGLSGRARCPGTSHILVGDPPRAAPLRHHLPRRGPGTFLSSPAPAVPQGRSHSAHRGRTRWAPEAGPSDAGFAHAQLGCWPRTPDDTRGSSAGVCLRARAQTHFNLVDTLSHAEDIHAATVQQASYDSYPGRTVIVLVITVLFEL